MLSLRAQQPFIATNGCRQGAKHQAFEDQAHDVAKPHHFDHHHEKGRRRHTHHRHAATVHPHVHVWTGNVLPQELRGLLINKSRRNDIAGKRIADDLAGRIRSRRQWIEDDHRLAAGIARLSPRGPEFEFYDQALQALRHLPDDRGHTEIAIDIRLGLRAIFGATADYPALEDCMREAEALALSIEDRPRLAAISNDLVDEMLHYHAALCGRVLARAHARGGDAAHISGYIGSGATFDVAIADFAMAYRKQVESDWRLFAEAIKAGVIEARTE